MAETDATARGQRRGLTRDRVLAAALELADDEGIEAVTMRGVAAVLGVEAMSLYNHVASKSDLLDAIVDLVVAQIELPGDGVRWDEAIRTCARSAHATYLAHPWACPLVMAPSLTGATGAPRLGYVEWLLSRLDEAGYAPDLVYRGYHAIDSHVLGFTMWQLGHSVSGIDVEALAAQFMRDMQATYPHLVDHAAQHLAARSTGGTAEFAFGLELVLEGLERAHRAR